MEVLLIAILAGAGFIVAYFTYGRWLGSRIFELSVGNAVPSQTHADGRDFVPTKKSIVFGHHFTSIAGTGPIVGPAIAVMWGWLPALLWVVFGSIFIGAVHDFAALVVSLRHQGKTVGEIAGTVLNKRVRVLFLAILYMALLIVLAIFGLVIAAVFDLYPSAIFPCVVQIPLAVLIGVLIHRRGMGLLLPSVAALVIMYFTVIFGDWGMLHSFNHALGGEAGVMGDGIHVMWWVIGLLAYSGIASVLPVWLLLQPRDYINSLQLLSMMLLIVLGLVGAAFLGGAPPADGLDRQPLQLVAPMWDIEPNEAPMIFPFLFITIACGAISGFHCLVSSGTSSKQLMNEPDARFVGYGSMLTEGFLATLVILACTAGIGLGVSHVHIPAQSQTLTPLQQLAQDKGREVISESMMHSFENRPGSPDLDTTWFELDGGQARVTLDFVSVPRAGIIGFEVTGKPVFEAKYYSWNASNGLGAKVGAFVDGAGNFLQAIGVPGSVAVALLAVLVASFAATTLDTACRLQRYVVQGLAGCFVKRAGQGDCQQCGYDLRGHTDTPSPREGAGGGFESQGEPLHHQETVGEAALSPALSQGEREVCCPECGGVRGESSTEPVVVSSSWNPFVWLTGAYGATLFAVLTGITMAAVPIPGNDWTWANAGKGGMILWPMFGATNQLLGGLAFLVITFWLIRQKKPVWFIVLPAVFMLIMPAWALGIQLEQWITGDNPNWVLIGIAMSAIALEIWMLIEAGIVFKELRKQPAAT